MTLRELKALIDQIPQERLDQEVMVVAGYFDDDDNEMDKAVQQAKPGFHADDRFQDQWHLYNNTVAPIAGVSTDHEDAIYIVRD